MAFDLGQFLPTLAAGIGGTLGTIKLIRFIASRKEEPDPAEDHPSVRDYKRRLFPNGERDEIIAAINMLRVENIARQTEQAQTNATLRDIVSRLERHNI